jgi:two-component system chemotaxis response regulator CheY
MMKRRWQMKILIADDKELHRTLLQDMLISLGYEVVGMAEDGGEALKMAKKLRPDIVILDVVMPEMDGIEAARKMSSLGLPLRVVMCSFITSDSVVEEALSVGASAYIKKPPSEMELLGVLEGLRYPAPISCATLGVNFYPF